MCKLGLKGWEVNIYEITDQRLMKFISGEFKNGESNKSSVSRTWIEDWGVSIVKRAGYEEMKCGNYSYLEIYPYVNVHNYRWGYGWGNFISCSCFEIFLELRLYDSRALKHSESCTLRRSRRQEFILAGRITHTWSI